MKLSEYLQQLIGHELFVNQALEDEQETLPGGKLMEVGDDFVTLKVEPEAKGGFGMEDAMWIVPMTSVMSIIHISDCKKCAIEASVKVNSRGREPHA